MPTGNVAVVGLGRIGLPLALSFASRGLDVVGVSLRVLVGLCVTLVADH